MKWLTQLSEYEMRRQPFSVYVYYTKIKLNDNSYQMLALGPRLDRRDTSKRIRQTGVDEVRQGREEEARQSVRRRAGMRGDARQGEISASTSS